MRADVMYFGFLGQPLRRAGQSCRPVKTVAGVLYAFAIANDAALWYVKSTDGGFTWASPIVVKTGVSVLGIAVWADWWTPGDTGTKIHLAYFDSTNDDCYYRSLDTASDTLGTETVVMAGLTFSAASDSCISITKTIGGNLLVLGDFDGGAEKGLFRSVDAGANWTVRTDPTEGLDYFYILPGFAADTQDAIIIFWDRSNSELSRKLYDDSADSTAETSIATSMLSVNADVCSPQFAVTVDDANNKILLAAWSARDTANADLRFWSIDESSITEGTNVVLNSTDDQQLTALALDSMNNDLYCFYGGKSDGSETAGTSINIYYKVSTDDGATWGAETKLTSVARNYDYLTTCLVFVGAFIALYGVNEATAPDNALMSVLFPQQKARYQMGI